MARETKKTFRKRGQIFLLQAVKVDQIFFPPSFLLHPVLTRSLFQVPGTKHRKTTKELICNEGKENNTTNRKEKKTRLIIIKLSQLKAQGAK